MKYVCTKCGHEKDSMEFYADPRNIFKGVISRCKECCRAYRKEHPAEYTEADRQRGNAWRRQNLEHCREQERARRERNRESSRAAVLKWARANPDGAAKHRVAKRTRIPKWAGRDKIKIVYLKAKQFGLEVDHVVPLLHPLVCGLHVWENLQLLDKFTNGSKSNHEWPDMPEPEARL